RGRPEPLGDARAELGVAVVDPDEGGRGVVREAAGVRHGVRRVGGAQQRDPENLAHAARSWPRSIGRPSRTDSNAARAVRSAARPADGGTGTAVLSRMAATNAAISARKPRLPSGSRWVT